MNLNITDRDAVVAEFKSNTRLRVGGYFIVFLILVYIGLVWSDFNRDRFRQLQSLRVEHQSLQEIEPQAVWLNRVQNAETRVTHLSQKLWRSESPGLAMARIQAALSQLVKKDSHIEQNVRVGTPQPVEGLQDVYRVRARVGVALTAEQLSGSLLRVTGNDQRLYVERLNLKFVRGRWNVELLVAAYFEIQGGDNG